MSAHNHDTQTSSDILSPADRDFLERIGDDKELLNELVEKTIEVCNLCGMLKSQGAILSDTMEAVHQKLHHMVEAKVADGALIRIDVDGQSVLALAGCDVEVVKADVRKAMAEQDMGGAQNAPSSGAVQ
jgi:hypothetical protein